jgi:hypothetical protein
MRPTRSIPQRRSSFTPDVLTGAPDALSGVLQKDTPHLLCGEGIGTMSLTVRPAQTGTFILAQHILRMSLTVRSAKIVHQA